MSGGEARFEAAGASTAARIRLALLDELPNPSAALVAWLDRHAPQVELAIVAASWAELVQNAAFPTDVVVLDLAPVGPVSLEARVRACRSAGVVVVGLAGDEGAVERAAALGIPVTIGRSATGPEFVGALRAALEAANGGDSWRVQLLAGAASRPKLSQGERQALRLYASGLSTIEVGREMNVKYETAKTYLRRVRDKYAKVGRPASKKIELIRRATEDGILE